MNSTVIVALCLALLAIAPLPATTRVGMRNVLKTAQPVVITLAADLETNLDGEYARVANMLAGAGVLHLSLDLPAHGADGPGLDSLKEWRRRIESGTDLIGSFTTELRSTIQGLVDQGKIDPSRVALVGFSRGGFLAMHAAAVGIGTHVVAIAPVTTLGALVEFNGAADHPYVRASHVANHAGAIGRVPLFVVAGHKHPRVDTGETIVFWRAMVAAHRTERLTMWLAPSDATRLLNEDGIYRASAEWLREQWGLPKANPTP